MNNGEKGSKSIKELVVNTCWQYLYENFHKFTETNKIKIALELAKKDLPVQVEGELKGGDNKVVIIKEMYGNQGEAGRLPGSVLVKRE
jgi:hypothetical protein